MSASANLLLLMPATLWMAGCDIENFGDSNRFKEDFHHEYTLAPGGRLEIENFNGSIEITGWDRDKVDVSGTKYAATQDALDDLKVEISNAPDSVRIRSVRPVERRSNMGVRYVISVPRKTLLDRVVSSNGSIRVQQVEGTVKLKSSNGSIRVEQTKGDLEAGTSNGSITVQDFSGGVILRTSNGSINASGVRGFLEARTSNGSVNATMAEASGKPVRVETSNGRIQLTIEKLSGSDIIATTSNSSLTVRLPDGLNAKLRAATSNSSISNAFETRVQGQISKKRIEGTIGSGGPLVDLTTSNGAIRIEKL